MKPVRAMLIDLENNPRELRRRLRPMRDKLGDRLERRTLFIYSRPEGLDLGVEGEDRDWLRARVRRTRAELMAIGPAYKMSGGDPNSEQDMKPVVSFLDELRADYGIAIIVEAHLTHGGDGGRPFGWSGWRRWPEIGLELRESGQLVHWRTPRHETQAIPPALKRGGEWPFTIATRPRDVLWASVVDHCHSALTRPTVRDLASAFGISKSTVQRALDEHKEEWEALFDE